ncbi:hypothetical protein CYPRO_0474 [Cyclonatronum proteinivorum]|uniref:Uncharacterized protein n=1 Tax=Cyclonatronum proteinivorum TaxID=1457365 RepID=A0A345UH08_9BACT|nr:hypothetical protein CYPRO_0474 [Cyclonatronum proteinivorum]
MTRGGMGNKPFDGQNLRQIPAQTTLCRPLSAVCKHKSPAFRDGGGALGCVIARACRGLSLVAGVFDFADEAVGTVHVAEGFEHAAAVNGYGAGAPVIEDEGA